MPSNIGWTDETWNPVIGCKPVSEGCRNCYAEAIATDFAKRGIKHYEEIINSDKTKWKGNAKFIKERLKQPKGWKNPRMVFTCSMSDICHPDVSDEELTAIFDVMREASQHQYQVLTKRPERFIEAQKWLDIPPHVWIGTSVENNKVLHRVKQLREIKADIRFLSCEPLLEDIAEGLKKDLGYVHWVIVGGESGPNHRPCKYKWVHNIYKECKIREVPFFFKQWSHKRPGQGKFCLPGEQDPVENQYPIKNFGIETEPEPKKEPKIHPNQLTIF